MASSPSMASIGSGPENPRESGEIRNKREKEAKKFKGTESKIIKIANIQLHYPFWPFSLSISASPPPFFMVQI
jgi:hypothetical protein